MGRPALLALLLVVWAGLQALYLGDKAFGAPVHYVSALVWGFGARAILTQVFEAFGRFLSTLPQLRAYPYP